jgi:hemoglobin-like flavoprotein
MIRITPTHTLFLSLIAPHVTCRIFELSPSVKSVFNIANNQDIRSNPNFTHHARTFVDMMDCAVGFLGPDLDPFAEDLQELGGRHLGYGVHPSSFKDMGRAFFYALTKFLGGYFDARRQHSFQTVFDFIAANMESGYKNKSMRSGW